MSKYEPYAREGNRTPVAGKTLWCPFCDNWKLTDSIAARKKLGQHLANDHEEEVLFAVGQRPPPLVDA